MKTILVPTDFSETANKARDYAIQIAQAFDAEVTLLHTYHIPHTGASAAPLISLDEIAGVEAKKQMDKQMEYLNSNYSNVTFHTYCNTGLVVEYIKELLSEQPIDLIVMGTTGASGVVDNIFGSNTAALIGSINIPIIAVPSNGVINLPKRIVVATDLQESSENTMFDVLRDLGQRNESQFDFLTIVKDDDSEERKQLKLKSADFDEEFDPQYHPFHIRENENIEDGILDYIEKKDFDLLVVVSHQRTFWEGLFHKSISKALVKHTTIPTLVIPD